MAKFVDDSDERSLLIEELETICRADSTTGSLLDIFVLGKPGCGKSSLCGDILDQDVGDKSSPKSVTVCVKTYKVNVGDYEVTVTDTPGMFESTDRGNEEQIARKVQGIIANDRNGFVIVCIEMFAGRLTDRNNLAPLAFLHQKCGKEIWRHVIIALTKADQYPKEQWLTKKNSILTSKKEFLTECFKSYMDETKKTLRECFTGNTSVREDCHIGMTEEEFDELNILILPTSKLFNPFLEKMRLVGCETWFDMLLVELCKRESGLILVSVHSKRLLNLMEVRNFLSEVAEYPLIQQQVKNLKIAIPPVVLLWKAFKSYSWKTAKEAPRFEVKSEPANERVQNNCVCL